MQLTHDLTTEPTAVAAMPVEARDALPQAAAVALAEIIRSYRAAQQLDGLEKRTLET